ncbi:hypothetical protein [Hyphomonas oceanitis]|uniref:hypothetical protein n=1 Tax=Hyphomonas oceanitis TaxID=81033 RepID=UPI00300259F9
MKRSGFAATALWILAWTMAACGGSDASGEPSQGAVATGDSPQAAPEAKESADHGLGKLKCPAKIRTQTKGPDIIGLKLGMSRDEAVNIVRCHADDAYIEFEDRWFEPRGFNMHETTLEKQAFVALSGETSACDYSSFDRMQRCGAGGRQWDHVSEKIKVATPGIPGGETVVGVWRTQTFKEGETPAVDSVIAALTKKYGRFQVRQVDHVNNNLWSDRIELAWVRDADDTPLSEADPALGACARNVRARVDEGQVWRDGCGLTIAATLLAPRTNPAVVGEFSVGMMNQGALYAYQEALQLQLDDIETKRRANELEKAQSSDVDL